MLKIDKGIFNAGNIKDAFAFIVWNCYGFLLYEKRKDAFNGRITPYNIKDIFAFFIYKIVFGFLKLK